MSYIAILIGSVAAAGYIFSTRSFLLKYKVARESGHRLYLTSLSVGIVFLFLVLIGGICISPVIRVLEVEPYNALTKEMKELFTGVCTISLAYFSSVIHNAYGGPDLKIKKLWKEWRKSDFEYICGIAQNEFKPVAVTLDNRKVYVGFVTGSLEPISDEGRGSYIRVLPFYSGHRNKEDLKLELTNRYSDIQNAHRQGTLKPEDLNYFSVVIPRNQIAVFHIYNQHLYESISGHNLSDT